MAKIDSNFEHDIFQFLHLPIRVLDESEGKNFIERWLTGPQTIFEQIFGRIENLQTLNDPANIRADLLKFLKSHVGFTSELNSITNDISENDLRKLIRLAVALWKQKGLEVGWENIIRLFTGRQVRIFNWFDFRYIVGEVSAGEEQLGEDSWMISVPGIEASSPSSTVVNLLTFEGDAKDKTEKGNDGVVHGSVNFFPTVSGFPQGSDKYVSFSGGVVRQDNIESYDLSGDLTVEVFFRSTVAEASKTLIHKQNASGVGFKITMDKSANTISYEIGDGVTTISDTLAAGVDLDDGNLRHIALVVDRAKDGVRLWLNGTEATAKSALGALGDMTSLAPLFVGGEGIGIGAITADMDNFRMSLTPVYDVDTGTLSTPLSGFIEFQEEQLDEFFSDIRIVDTGDLNKVLIQRIVNLMRPISERVNLIYVSFYDNFVDGAGNFIAVTGNINLTIEPRLEVSPSSIAVTDVLGDSDWTDIVLQIKFRILESSGSVSGIFFYQDSDNFYEFKVDFTAKTVTLIKVVAGAPTTIGAASSEDIVAGTDYFMNIVTDKSVSGDTIIKTYIDRNKHHEVVDSAFDKGKFGVKTDASTTISVDEIELMEIPIDLDQVLPGFNL